MQITDENNDELDIKNEFIAQEEIEEEEKNSLHSKSKDNNKEEIKSQETCKSVINDFLKIKNCTIIKYGIRPTPTR